MAEDWTKSEIDAVVADYFGMLGDELAGRPFVKLARYRSLAERIPRNIKSIERKHQNISAIMIGFGQPWVTGLKPAKHYQNALADGVLRWLDQRPDWLEPKVQSDEGSHVREMPSLWIGPPPTHQNEPPLIDPTIMAAIGKKYDVAERDARNRRLGKAGEELILHHERQSLLQAGRNDLADKVRWTAVQDGDGYGFDIASFEPDGRERLIEVKTTNGWERTPFHISQNEIAVAESRRDEWHLVRVWNFARQPKAFSLRPPLSAHIELTPTSFLAALR